MASLNCVEHLFNTVDDHGTIRRANRQLTGQGSSSVHREQRNKMHAKIEVVELSVANLSNHIGADSLATLLPLDIPQQKRANLIRLYFINRDGAYVTCQSFIALLLAFSRKRSLAIHGLQIRCVPVHQARALNFPRKGSIRMLG
jgi:hypothetical protein